MMTHFILNLEIQSQCQKRCCDYFPYPLNDGYGENLEVLVPADILCCRNSSEKLQRNFVIIKRKRIGYLPSEKHYYKCNYFVYFFNEVIIKCNLNFITCLLYILPLPLKLPKNYQQLHQLLIITNYPFYHLKLDPDEYLENKNERRDPNFWNRLLHIDVNKSIFRISQSFSILQSLTYPVNYST